jgi:arsenate reductase
MRALMVCEHNAGRSQMARALLARYRPDWEVVSAGVGPDLRGTHVPDSVVDILAEIRVELDRRTPRVLLSERAVEWADLIVMIVVEDRWPDFVDRSKVVQWDVDDPRGKSIEVLRRARDEINRRCRQLAGDAVIWEPGPGSVDR